MVLIPDPARARPNPPPRPLVQAGQRTGILSVEPSPDRCLLRLLAGARKRRHGLGALAAAFPCLASLSCTDGSLSPSPESPYSLEIIAPDRARVGESLPVVVRAIDGEGGVDPGVNLEDRIGTGEGMEPIELKKGVGSVSLVAVDNGTGRLSLDLPGASRVVSIPDSIPLSEYTGQLEPGDRLWDRSRDRYVPGHLVVPAGTTLSIEEGTRILLGPLASITVHGRLRARGTLRRPIVFLAKERNRPWGGIEVNEGTAEFAHTFLVNGGADPGRVFGHSSSQPVLMARRAEVALTACFFLDNPGKALGAWESRVAADRCLITRCDTGGEFSRSVVLISSSHVIDIPNGDGIPVDDDNDGFYFHSVHPHASTPSMVRDSFVITGKDDAIDHNGALLEVRNCWLEGFSNEGVAASNANWVRIFNTVVRGCGQGIEAGYGSPRVMVDHCVVVENEVGLRFGDSYDWGSRGRMVVSNSIVYDNADNVLNHDRKTGQPVPGGITISYSLVEDSDLDSSTTVWSEMPIFDDDYFLLPSSPGKGQGIDGSDIGLIDPSGP